MYHGHIHMLIGMDTAGTLTGVIVDWNTEPYAYIALEKPEFPAMFVGKSIRDKFVAGEDVDIMSRATITRSSGRARNPRCLAYVARAVSTPDAVKP